MMMGTGLRTRFLLSLVTWVSCCCSFAQYNSDFLNYSRTGRSVGINAEGEIGSNGFTSDLINKLLWGGYVPNSLKQSASSKMHGRNNFGALMNYDINAFIKGGKKFDFMIAVKDQQVVNATFTKDFYNLMFYGNQRFAGSVANLKNCNVNALRFQELKFGMIAREVDSVGMIGFSVSLLKGDQLFYIQTHNNSTLYTSADGSEIIFNSNFNMAISDTARRNFFRFTGIGASADIFFETSYKSKFNKRSVLVVNANNIGFIHWQNNSVQYSSDSVLHYTGYHVNKISDLRDSTLRRINGDSMLRSLTNARKEPFNVNIPTNLVIINRMYFGELEKFNLTLGYRYIFNANYNAYFFLEPEYRLGRIWMALHGGYGGYGRLNIGASVTLNTKGWYIKVGSNGLQGFLLPSISYGQGVYLSVVRKMR